MAIEVQPEVEIWRRPQKSSFWPWFPIRSFRQFLAKTYRFATIQNVIDRWQTDRWQSVPTAKGATVNTVGQNNDRFCNYWFTSLICEQHSFCYRNGALFSKSNIMSMQTWLELHHDLCSAVTVSMLSYQTHQTYYVNIATTTNVNNIQ